MQKRKQWLTKVPVGINKPLFLSLLVFSLNTQAWAQGGGEQYVLNGKSISKEQYQGAVLAKEGVALLHANNNRDAVVKLKQAADLFPGFADIHLNLGIGLAKTGQIKEAISELELARNLNPGLDSAWMSLGGLYQTEGRLKDAVGAYSEFVKRFPQHKDAQKVASLITGLSKEASAESAVKSDINAQDYFAEITRTGKVRWPSNKMPLKVFIAPGADVPGYQKDSDNLLKQCFVDWQNASKGAVAFVFTPSEKDSDIQCSWTNDATRFKNIAEAGETQFYSGRNGIVKGTIAFLTIPLVPDMPLTVNRMRLIFLHEIGHVIGLAGHTNNPKDAMFYSIDIADVWKDLTERDANTVVRLYSQP